MQSPFQSKKPSGKRERGSALIVERFHPSTAAFTLVELCVAIFVLALLVILVAWAGSSSRQTAAMAKSMVNLRTISHGLHAYITEHNGCFPESAQDVWVHGEKVYYWYNALSYYIDGVRDFKAAEASAIRPNWQTCPGRVLEPALYAKRGVAVGYGWNHQAFGVRSSADYIHRYGWNSRLTEVELPSQTIIIGTNREYEKDGIPIEAGDPANPFLYATSPTSRRFNGAGLYLFVDGSVKRMTPEEITSTGPVLGNYPYLFKKIKSLRYNEDKRPQ